MVEFLVLASIEIGTHTFEKDIRTMVCDTQASIQYEMDRPRAPMSRSDCRYAVLKEGDEYTNLTWIDAAGGNEFLLAVTDVDGETVFTVRQLRKKVGHDA